MLKDRLNKLLDELKVTKLTISQYAGIDRTSISHAASGKRIYNKHSTATKKIVDGIYLYAKDSKKLKTVSKITGVDSRLSANNFKSGMIDWLYEGMPSKYLIDKKNYDKAIYISKVSVLLERYNISNAEISQKLKCDPSVISRYRNGGKDVNPTSKVSVGIANKIWNRIEETNDYKYICKVSGIKKDKLNKKSFKTWFTDYDAAIVIPRDANTKLILESFSATATTKPKRLRRSKSLILPTKQDNAPNTYIGNDGLRKAVEQFLSTALEKKPKELYLYSDNYMKWMTEDTEFFTKWQNAMLLLVQKGVKIIIIHNLRRSTPEMINAIAGWLPLYQTGMVEPYYYAHMSLSNAFSHTIFINPKGHAITGMPVKGMEDNCIYHYSTDSAEISLLNDSFKHMKESATPLVEHSDSIPSDTQINTYTYNGIDITITRDGVYLTHSETGVNIGLKHHMLVKIFKEFCEEL